MTHALGYIRCSTDEQAASALGLDAQRTAIAGEAERRGWSVDFEADEGYSGKLRNRPGLDRALARLSRAEGRRSSSSPGWIGWAGR